MSKNQLIRRLESALGSEAVRSGSEDLAHYTVDGKQPAAVCLPGGIDQVATALRLCVESDAAVAPWGGGTATRIGNLPRRLDVVIGLKQLDALVEHDHANLTATVQSGMTLDTLQGLLAKENQFLAWDIPFAAGSTIGGVVAANLNGPRRNYYGGVRDLVIGMKVLLPSGEQIKAGGKVVKNVAGYDMCKLFVGSLGTLGIITEVTVRMTPIPHASATLMASGTLMQASQLVEELSRSPLQPAAVVIANSGLRAVSGEEWAVAIRTDGFEESVARHLRDTGGMAEGMGLRAVVLRDSSHNLFWNDIDNFPLQSKNLVYRVTVPRASTARVARVFQNEWPTGEFSTAIVGDTATGIVWMAITAEQADAVKFPRVTSLAQEYSGHAVLFAAPPKSKEGIDVWGPSPPTIPIMKDIKRRFDPQSILNPGRFLASI